MCKLSVQKWRKRFKKIKENRRRQCFLSYICFSVNDYLERKRVCIPFVAYEWGRLMTSSQETRHGKWQWCVFFFFMRSEIEELNSWSELFCTWLQGSALRWHGPLNPDAMIYFFMHEKKKVWKGVAAALDTFFNQIPHCAAAAMSLEDLVEKPPTLNVWKNWWPLGCATY